MKIFSGQGPGIKITISTVGNVKTDLKSEFTAQGINQTLHRVYLQVECEVSILTPFDTIERSITNQVLIAENVIVGHIPETYYNLEGLKQDDAMEVMQ
ncbi:MAG: sporulation protein YunB [Clostridia bacterium]|nr:sporulation protein YunB [Clostridia bacterium]